MIVDEVKTGFRVGKGGAQALYGIEADIFTVAKAMANGYPIAAIGGKEEIMRKYGKGVAHGGTYTAQAMSLAAAEKTLTILKDTDALEDIANYGKAMQDGMHKVLSRRGIPHSFTGHHSMSGLFFSAQAPTTYRNWKLSDYTFYDTMAGILIDMGVMCEPDSREPWFISAGHDEACLERDAEQVRAGGRPDPRRTRRRRRRPRRRQEADAGHQRVSQRPLSLTTLPLPQTGGGLGWGKRAKTLSVVHRLPPPYPPPSGEGILF